MKINTIDVGKFAKPEYTTVAPTKEGLNGRDLLIYGDNRSGKTLTFNAILYCLLGSQETIDLATGRGNRVTLSFNDEVTFARGQPHAELDVGGDTRTGDTAKEDFKELTGPLPLLKPHFLHSHVEQLPLSRLSPDERLDEIRAVTNAARQQEITWHSTATKQISELLIESEDALRRVEDEQPDIDDQITSVERQLEDHQTTQSLIESGQLERIADQLQRDTELDAELDELFKEQESLRQQLDRLHKRKRRHAGYAREVIDIISEAVNDFICPACDGRITTEKAKNRIEGGYCPYCGQQGSIKDIKDRISDRVESADKVVAELTEDIEELERRQNELEAEVESVKAQKPGLSNLDATIKRQLRDHGFDIADIAENTEAEIQAAQETLEELRTEQEALEAEREALEDRIDVYEASLEEAESAVKELESVSYTQEIQEFADQWTTNYREMAGELGFEIGINPDGDVLVPGGAEESEPRQYGRLGDLSDSEVRLLNISYVYTLNEAATTAGLTSWKVFVLDEPFAHLDQASTKELLEYIVSSDRQFIITTSNNTVADQFDDYHTVQLTRGPIQSELGAFL